MRTNIVIDDDLMNDAIRLTGAKTKRETVELALKSLIEIKKQGEIKKLRGKLNWEGNLEDMRLNK
jgi:Arc/MetJ family transcription regulator